MRFAKLFSTRSISQTVKLLDQYDEYILPRLRKIMQEEEDYKKCLKVSLVGYTNAGKSTLVNTMMNLPLCAASRKAHTTMQCQRVFLVKDGTQIILTDTPGLSTESDKKGIKLEEDVFVLEELKQVNLICVVVDAANKFSRSSIWGPDTIVKKYLLSCPPETKLALVLNKVDAIKEKRILLDMVNKLLLEVKEEMKEGNRAISFSRIFMISALKNDGVKDLVDYFCSLATELPTTNINYLLSDFSHITVIEQRVRAELMQISMRSVPIRETCKVEYMDESELGIVRITVIISTNNNKIHNMLSDKDGVLERVRLKCQSDFKALFKKTVNLDLILRLKQKKERKTKGER